MVAASETEEEASHYVVVRLPDGGRMMIGEGQLKEAAGLRKGEDSEQIKAQRKYWIDVCLYEELKKLTGQTLAWGILTGVRPTKIAMEKLEEGWERDRFVAWFQKKAELSFEIAGRERSLLGELDCENGYSLYVGIPFCPSVCTYCSFSSGALSDWSGRIWDYLSALESELEFIGERCRRGGQTVLRRRSSWY